MCLADTQEEFGEHRPRSLCAKLGPNSEAFT